MDALREGKGVSYILTTVFSFWDFGCYKSQRGERSTCAEGPEPETKNMSNVCQSARYAAGPFCSTSHHM